MKLTERHRAAIELIITHQFDALEQKEMARMIGVTRQTLWNWMKDDEFQTALIAARSEWRKQIDHIPFVHRRVRLEELTRLYHETPDSYVSGFAETRGPIADPETGKVLVDGEGNAVSAVIIRRMNVDTKAKLLSQIAEEVGGDIAEELEDLREEVKARLKVVGA